MEFDAADWSGDGDFTEVLVAELRAMPEVAFLRVADSPASRTESGYAFLSNELFVGFTRTALEEPSRWPTWWPFRRRYLVPALDLAALDVRLSAIEAVGPADYADDGMLQYLKSQRIVAPYQTRGVKLVEMVRVYEVGTTPRR